jgi:hypothetical protein
MSDKKQSYSLWMAALDSLFQNDYGVSVHDVADQPFRDMFDDGYSVEEAAECIAQDEGVI